jgi:hypothetical protein
MLKLINSRYAAKFLFKKIWGDIKQKSFLNYNVDIKKYHQKLFILWQKLFGKK